MKNALTAALVFVTLAAFSGPAFAGQKETPKTPPPGAAATQTSAPARNSGHATEQLMTGKVVKVDAKTRSFTVISKGKEVTFSAEKLSALPKVGEILDISYSQTPGERIKATTINTSKSNHY